MIQFYKENFHQGGTYYSGADKGLAGVWYIYLVYLESASRYIFVYLESASLTLDIQSNDTKYFFVIFKIFFEFIKLSLHIILLVWSILTTLFRMPRLQSALSSQLPLYLFTVFTALFMHHMAYYTLYIFVVVCLSLLYWKFHKAGDAILVMTSSLYTVTSTVPRTHGWVLSELYDFACSRGPITYELYDLDAKSLCAQSVHL